MSDEEWTFAMVVDWLADREGRSVYVEVGMRDPTLDSSDFFPIAQHLTLGKAQIGEDAGHERGIVYLPFDVNREDPNRLYIDQARITTIQWSAHGGKLYFHDGPMYLGITGG